MWDKIKHSVEQGNTRAYLAWDLAFLKSGVAIVLMPGTQVCWTKTLIAQPRRPKKVTNWVIQQRLKSLSEQTSEWELEKLVPYLSGVFAETPEQFQFVLAKSGKGSSHAAIVSAGMVKAWLIISLWQLGWEKEIVFVDPQRIDKGLAAPFPITRDLIAQRHGDIVAGIVAKSMSKTKMRRRFSLALITNDRGWWSVKDGKLVRSEDEGDAAAIGVVGAQMAEFGDIDSLRVSWRRK